MLLGDILARFEDESVAAETLLGLHDLVLVARLKALAEAEGCSLGQFAAKSVRDYSANASDEEWITLMGALGRTVDPGAVCMKRAFEFVLSFYSATPLRVRSRRTDDVECRIDHVTGSTGLPADSITCHSENPMAEQNPLRTCTDG
jgi:hypothetical protein